MPGCGSSPGTKPGKGSHIVSTGEAFVGASIAKEGVDFGLRHEEVNFRSSKDRVRNLAYNDLDSSTQRPAGPPLPGGPWCQ